MHSLPALHPVFGMQFASQIRNDRLQARCPGRIAGHRLKFAASKVIPGFDIGTATAGIATSFQNKPAFVSRLFNSGSSLPVTVRKIDNSVYLPFLNAVALVVRRFEQEEACRSVDAVCDVHPFEYAGISRN